MPSPEETTAAAREFLAEYPETEDALVALLERDADGEAWTFAETELDSGRFGELVSRDLATAVDDRYRLRHPDAIRAAIDASGSDRPMTPHTAMRHLRPLRRQPYPVPNLSRFSLRTICKRVSRWSAHSSRSLRRGLSVRRRFSVMDTWCRLPTTPTFSGTGRSSWPPGLTVFSISPCSPIWAAPRADVRSRTRSTGG